MLTPDAPPDWLPETVGAPDEDAAPELLWALGGLDDDDDDGALLELDVVEVDAGPGAQAVTRSTVAAPMPIANGSLALWYLIMTTFLPGCRPDPARAPDPENREDRRVQ